MVTLLLNDAIAYSANICNFSHNVVCINILFYIRHTYRYYNMTIITGNNTTYFLIYYCHQIKKLAKLSAVYRGYRVHTSLKWTL